MDTCTHENCNTTASAKTFQRPRFITSEDTSGSTVQIALPGVKKEDVALTLLEASLKIEAKRGDSVPADWKPHKQASSSADYALELQLGSRLDGTRTTATLDSGILTLKVPLKEEAKPRQIEVN